MNPASGSEGLDQAPFESVDPTAIASADEQLVRHHCTEDQPRQVLLVEGPKSLAKFGIVESGDVDVRVEEEHDLLGGRGEVVRETAVPEQVAEPPLRLLTEAGELVNFIECEVNGLRLGGGSQDLLGAIDLALVKDQVLAFQAALVDNCSHREPSHRSVLYPRSSASSKYKPRPWRNRSASAARRGLYAGA